MEDGTSLAVARETYVNETVSVHELDTILP